MNDSTNTGKPAGIRVGSGRNSEYGSGTGTDNIMGYGSGSTNAVPADLYSETVKGEG